MDLGELRYLKKDFLEPLIENLKKKYRVSCEPFVCAMPDTDGDRKDARITRKIVTDGFPDFLYLVNEIKKFILDNFNFSGELSETKWNAPGSKTLYVNGDDADYDFYVHLTSWWESGGLIFSFLITVTKVG